MAEITAIEWTDHTFNPWVGCTKVSPACDNCYAETLMANRYKYVEWGPRAARRITSDDSWRKPRSWNRKAQAAGERQTVFCASTADVFEGRGDTAEARSRLWPLVEQTQHLNWLFLTKRPSNVRKLAPWGEAWPANVWVGATVENQEWATRRLPHLVSVPSVGRFVSVEPMLGAINLRPYLGHGPGKINWVICGGESGHGARGHDDMINWYRDLRDQCFSAGVPFFFKQWGNFAPDVDGVRLIQLSKKNTESLLDGVQWRESPFRLT